MSFFPRPEQVFAALRRGRGDILTQYPIAPLDSPGMPPLGPDFQRAVADLLEDNPQWLETYGDKASIYCGSYLVMRALYDTEFRLHVQFKGRSAYTPLIQGHLWDYAVVGPCRTTKDVPQIMIIGKHPGADEERAGRNFIGPTSDLFQDVLHEVGVDPLLLNEAYMTNLVRHGRLDPASDRVSSAWIKNCGVLLHQELRLVRPDYIFCLGSEACQYLLGKQYSVTTLSGRVTPFEIPIGVDADGAPVIHTAQIMASVHPASVAYKPEMRDQLKLACDNFRKLAQGYEFKEVEDDIDHVVVDNAKDLSDVVDLMMADPTLNRIAVDCEWEGEHPDDPGAYLRTIQVSHKDKFACCVMLYDQTGKECFKPSLGAARRLLLKLLKSTPGRPVCVGGHFFRSDLPRLIHFGIDLRAEYAPPDFEEGKAPPWERTKTEGGFDTGLQYHALSATQELKLELLALKHTTVPRYDVEKEREVDAECTRRKIKKKYLEGFGFMTDKTICAYGNYDADSTKRLDTLANGLPGQPGLLDAEPITGKSVRMAYWNHHRASLAVLEMEMTGIGFDKERAVGLMADFELARNQLLADLREETQWPSFNPKSDNQTRELLFGVKLNKAVNKLTGRNRRLRPKGAKCFNLTPVKTTSKPSKNWDVVVQRGQEDIYSPSTDKEVLGILGRRHPTIWKLRNFRFCQQVLQTVLRPPDVPAGHDVATQLAEEYEDDPVYSRGLLSFVRPSGRIHTRIRQTLETCRFASLSPNLQNLCFDPMTEFLTQRGWVRAGELKSDDHVAQFWPGDDGIDFVVPSTHIVEDFDGELVHLNGVQYDLLTTPNHRHLLRHRRTREYMEVLASSLAGPDSERLLTHAGHWRKDGGVTMNDMELTFLCAAQADGHYVRQGGISFTFHKRRKAMRLRLALESLGIDFRYQHVGASHYFYIGKKANRRWLAWLDCWLPDKQFGPQLLQLSYGTLKRFTRELCHWDGLHMRGTEYSSSIKQNADWAQIAFVLTGTRARIRPYQNSTPNAGLHYCVDWPADRRATTSLVRAAVTQTPYRGRVYCVTVPSSFVVVRRNGKVTISGNSKKREEDYAQILGKRYRHPIRSSFVASPGHVLIEADLKSAELAMIGWLAQCPQMIEDVERNCLPKTHPDYLEIHCETAVRCFQIETGGKKITKDLLAELGCKHLRISAKNVNFGIPYGRSDEAIMRQCWEEGAFVTLQDCAAVRDYYFTRWPENGAFLDACRACVYNPGYLRGIWGAMRHAPITNDEKAQKDLEREFCNFLIQNGVAEGMDEGLSNLYHYRETNPVLYRILLQIHDAVLLEVPYRYAERVVTEVLPACFVDGVAIWPTYPTGERMPHITKPYRFGIDIEIFEHWGEKLSKDELKERGIRLPED